MKIAIVMMLILIHIGNIGCSSSEGKHKMQNIASKQMQIYYISPKVLTRSAVQPDVLKIDSNLVDVRPEIRSKLEQFIATVKSAKHAEIKESLIKYDFRLCVQSDGIFYFNEYGNVVLIGDKLLSLSHEEEVQINDIYGKLDSSNKL